MTEVYVVDYYYIDKALSGHDTKSFQSEEESRNYARDLIKELTAKVSWFTEDRNTITSYNMSYYYELFEAYSVNNQSNCYLFIKQYIQLI